MLYDMMFELLSSVDIYMHMNFGKIIFNDFCAYLVVTICLRVGAVGAYG